MTEKEIETLAELISIKTADRYLKVTREIIGTELKLHSSTCEVKKYRKVAAAVSAIIGGVIVACVSWFLNKE